MTSQPIRFHGHVTHADFRAAFPKLRRGLPLWIGPAIPLAILLWQVARAGFHFKDLFSTIFWMLLFSVEAFQHLRWRAEWLRTWTGETTFEFGDFEFRIVSPVRTAACRWSQLDRVIQTKDHYLLVIGALPLDPLQQLYLVPKRFLSPAEDERWRQLALTVPS